MSDELHRHFSRHRVPRARGRQAGPPQAQGHTPLYPVVQHHLETFLATAEDEVPMGCGVPSWVERDFRAYLRCGILAHGLARARCDACGHERLVAFSCKGRGIRPSCNTRRMAEVAADLADQVLPWLPVRQWVLSVRTRPQSILALGAALAGFGRRECSHSAQDVYMIGGAASRTRRASWTRPVPTGSADVGSLRSGPA